MEDMHETFVKKYWEEQNVLFYLHFREGEAVEQIEVSAIGKVFLSTNDRYNGDSMLYDQSLDELDLHQSDFITEEEFYRVWNDR